MVVLSGYGASIGLSHGDKSAGSGLPGDLTEIGHDIAIKCRLRSAAPKLTIDEMFDGRDQRGLCVFVRQRSP